MRGRTSGYTGVAVETVMEITRVIDIYPEILG
jgi:hypothetical protein